MKSQCWGRKAKACLSECSRCCSLLKCQVLWKIIPPPPLSFSPSPSTPSSSQHRSRGWGMNPRLALAGGGKLHRFCCLQKFLFIYLFLLFYFFSTSPLWPLRWRQQSWWNETISLPSCSHSPAAVTLILLILSILSLMTVSMMWGALLKTWNILSAIEPICSVRGGYILQITQCT